MSLVQHSEDLPLHQHPHQDEEVEDAISINSGSGIAYHISTKDLNKLYRQYVEIYSKRISQDTENLLENWLKE